MLARTLPSRATNTFPPPYRPMQKSCLSITLLAREEHRAQLRREFNSELWLGSPYTLWCEMWARPTFQGQASRFVFDTFPKILAIHRLKRHSRRSRFIS